MKKSVMDAGFGFSHGIRMDQSQFRGRMRMRNFLVSGMEACLLDV
jgi:hypothetical protein